ncbi:hypothetical protein B0H19DRAFT_1180987 [Mycena capillaripes]|nr:hypothetical protein B0H19DRAFT_1180987 [Mycena capillaripes]
MVCFYSHFSGICLILLMVGTLETCDFLYSSYWGAGSELICDSLTCQWKKFRSPDCSRPCIQPRRVGRQQPTLYITSCVSYGGRCAM